MTGYDIFLSDGDLLTTINVKTIDEQDNSSLVLIGQGIPNYGGIIAQNFVWMLENFSAATPPVEPLTGQLWHDRLQNRMNFFSGAEWHPFVTPGSGASGLFDMLGAAINIDFTTTHTATIFTGEVGKDYFSTQLLLIPNGTVTAATLPTFNLYTGSAGDILASTTPAANSAAKFNRLTVSSQPAIISGTASAFLQITAAATGGQLKYNAYLFGFTI